MDFLDGVIGFGGQAQCGRLGVYNHQHRVRVVHADQVVHGNVVAVQTRSRVIPANYFFSCCVNV